MLTAETNTEIAIHYINKFENDKILCFDFTEKQLKKIDIFMKLIILIQFYVREYNL